MPLPDIHPAHARAMAGFTLLEIVLSIGLLMMATTLVAGTLGPWLAFRQALETTARMREVQRVLELAMRDEAAALGDGAGSELVLSGGRIGLGTRSDAAGFRALYRRSTLSERDFMQDGWNMPYQVFVSNRLEHTVDGQALYYRRVAVVSGGRNGKVEPGTRFDPATGDLVVAGDDASVQVDGYPIVRALYDETLSRMRKVADAYQAYFQTRYLSDTRRDVAVDYFAGPCEGARAPDRWDGPDSLLTATCSSALGLDTDVARRALGITGGEAFDAFGQRLLLDNASAAVRSPENPDPAMAVPPYTAIVSARLPGGGMVRLSVIGAY